MLEELARTADVADRVRMLGPLAIDGLAEVLAAGDVLIVPSIWEEPFGLVCLEGALARVPVVASRIGGDDRRSCTMRSTPCSFARRRSRAAADAIARVLSAPDETAARVERAYARAGEFSTERYLRESERFVECACRALGASGREDRGGSALGSSSGAIG